MNNNQKEMKAKETKVNETSIKEKPTFIKFITKETWGKIAVALSTISIIISIVALSHKAPQVERHFAHDSRPGIEREFRPHFDRQGQGNGKGFKDNSDRPNMPNEQNRQSGQNRQNRRDGNNAIPKG